VFAVDALTASAWIPATGIGVRIIKTLRGCLNALGISAVAKS
jgi:hypothetical protein